MHTQPKPTNQLQRSKNEGEESGRNRTESGSNDQGQDAGSNASPALNPCIIWVPQYAANALFPTAGKRDRQGGRWESATMTTNRIRLMTVLLILLPLLAPRMRAQTVALDTASMDVWRNQLS